MTVLEDLATTLEVCGSAMSEAAARVFAAELSHYPADAVHAALTRCRREVMGRLSLAHVIERIDDGRPGSEEAWAMFPKDEYASAAITKEMAEAMAAALALLPDEIAARMAFNEIHRRKVSEARARREPVEWRITLGFDPAGRVAALRDAVKLGRISQERAAALGLLPEPSTAPQIEGPTNGAPQAAELARGLVVSITKRTDTAMAKKREDALNAADRAHAEGRRCSTGCDRCWGEESA
jgi:hypothetical protein